eukprot:COSAG02_NODE_981_length_15488_cov_27.585093_11_plen_43_part_00
MCRTRIQQLRTHPCISENIPHKQLAAMYLSVNGYANYSLMIF